MIHPKTEVHSSVFIPESSKVWQFTSILEGTEIGEDVVIGSGCWIGRNCRIGRGVHIQHGVFLPHASIVEDFAFIGPNVTMTDDRYPRSGNAAYVPQPPRICHGASIGAGAVILPGIMIGPGAMVAAGAVVTHNVLGEMWVAGIPAKHFVKRAL